MSPHAEAYLTGAVSMLGSRLIYIAKCREYLTQQTFDRLAKALRIHLTSQEAANG